MSIHEHLHIGHDHGDGEHAHAPPSRVPHRMPADPAHESLASALRSSFNVLRLIMLGLVVAYIASGVFVVRTGEQGLISRMGRLRFAQGDSPVFGQGWHLAWPDRFEEKLRLPGKELDLVIPTFTFKPQGGDETKSLEEMQPSSGGTLKPGVDGALISGDKNLSHGLFTVNYQIREGDKFVTNIGNSPADAEPLLRRLAENAIVQVAGGQPVERITLAGATMADKVKERLQADLDALQAGIQVNRVGAKTVIPPRVREAFDRVTIAQNEKLNAEQRARQREREILNRAAGPTYPKLLSLIDAYGAAQAAGAEPARLEQMRGEIDAALDEAGGAVAQTVREARSRSNAAREQIKRQYEEFVNQLDLYRKDPDLTVTRLWAEMRTRVLDSKGNEIFALPAGQDIEIITNRDERRRIEQEKAAVEDAARARAAGGRTQ